MLSRAGWHVTVATLCTQSVPNPKGFALACQLDKGLGPDVDYMALRRTEDIAAMRALGVAAFVHVPLAEAPHRGYHSAAALFQPPLADDPIAKPLASAIGDLIADAMPDLIFAPQAIGGHVDHVQVVRALGNVDRPIAWWRDFPYTTREASPAEPFASRMRDLPERGVTLDDDAIACRETACLAYASQLGFQFGGPGKLRARLREAGAREYFRTTSALPV